MPRSPCVSIVIFNDRLSCQVPSKRRVRVGVGAWGEEGAGKKQVTSSAGARRPRAWYGQVYGGS